MLAVLLGKIFHIIKLTYLLVSNIRLCNYRTLMCDQLFLQDIVMLLLGQGHVSIGPSTIGRWLFILNFEIEKVLYLLLLVNRWRNDMLLHKWLWTYNYVTYQTRLYRKVHISWAMSYQLVLYHVLVLILEVHSFHQI